MHAMGCDRRDRGAYFFLIVDGSLAQDLIGWAAPLTDVYQVCVLPYMRKQLLLDPVVLSCVNLIPSHGQTHPIQSHPILSQIYLI